MEAPLLSRISISFRLSPLWCVLNFFGYTFYLYKSPCLTSGQHHFSENQKKVQTRDSQVLSQNDLDRKFRVLKFHSHGFKCQDFLSIKHSQYDIFDADVDLTCGDILPLTLLYSLVSTTTIRVWHEVGFSLTRERRARCIFPSNHLVTPSVMRSWHLVFAPTETRMNEWSVRHESTRHSLSVCRCCWDWQKRWTSVLFTISHYFKALDSLVFVQYCFRLNSQFWRRFSVFTKQRTVFQIW